MMRCVAVLGSGTRCSREAAGEDELCPRHRSVAFRRGVWAFQLARVEAEDEEALVAAAALSGLDGEIAVLRVLIRRAVGSRDVDAARRGIESLCRALETKGRLEGGRGPQPEGRVERGAAKVRLDALLEGLGGQGPRQRGKGFTRTPGLADTASDGQAGSPSPQPSPARGEGVMASDRKRSRPHPRDQGGRPPETPTEGEGTDALEDQAAELALRHQAGEPEALGLLYSLLEVAIVGVALNERALQPPSAMSLEELQEESRKVLDELARRWRPGVSFLGYFFRTFPSAMARYARRGQGSKGKGPRPEGMWKGGALTPAIRGCGPLKPPQRERGQTNLTPSGLMGPKGSQAQGERYGGLEGPYSAEDLASLPEVERQILVLSALEGQSMRGIARRVGVPELAAYKLYQQARQRLEGRVRSLEGGELIALRRLVEAVHAAAGPGGGLPSRAWTMAAAGLKQLEYNQLIGRLEAAGAIEGRGPRQTGRLVERDPAATLARLEPQMNTDEHR